VTFDDERLSQDAGPLLLQRADARHGLTAVLSGALHEWRDPRFVSHTIEGPVRRRVYVIAQGYEDCNDLGELRDDPLFKACNERGANSASLARSEHRALRVEDLEPVQKVLPRRLLRRWRREDAPKSIVLDLDSTDEPAHGRQQFTMFNGYYGTHCYQQVYVFTADGDLPRVKLLGGTANVRASARDGLAKVVALLREEFPKRAITVRADNGLAGPELYDRCEDNRVGYVVICGTQRTWCERTSHQMMRAESLHAAGSPEGSAFVCGDFAHQASSWRCERHIVAKAKRTPLGSDQRFVVASLDAPAHEV